MKNTMLKWLAVGILLLAHSFAHAQTPTDSSKQLYAVIKSNGVEYIGYILQDDGREVLIETEKLGKVYIPKADIKEIRRVQIEKDFIDNEYKPNNPFTTRYSFTTNALPVNKGENYYLINLYGPEFHFAVSDRLNVGVMSTWIGSPIALAVKYTIPSQHENINYSVGSLIATSGYISNFSRFGGLHFANVTFGDRDKNLTLAAGLLHWQGGKYSLQTPGTYASSSYNIPMESVNYPALVGPMFSVAGFVRISKRASFVFDSMLGNFNRNIQSSTYRNNYDGSTGTWSRTVTWTNENRQTLAFFMMPGMRINRSETRAFQFSLAGVSVRQNINGKLDSYSFPLPLCSWFHTF